MIDILKAAGTRQGFALSQRSSLDILTSVVRNPMEAIPPTAFTHRATVSKVFGRVRVHLTDPELIQDALVHNADALAKGDLLKRVLGPALGDGLLTAEGGSWRHQRRTVSPAFRHERLVGMAPAMIAAAEWTCERWRARGDKTIDISHEMMLTTFRIIVETMLSGPGRIDAARVERCVTDYLAPTSWMFALGLIGAPEWVPFPGRQRSKAAAALMRRTVLDMVIERRRDPEEKQDLVALLLSAVDPDGEGGMSNEEIADNILTFITAGHETTAVALGWTLMLLAANPSAEARVRAEIATVVGDGPVLPDHIARLVYTRQAFQEAMRLYPPAPIIAREVLRDIDIGGLPVPAGTEIVVPIFALHRHAQLWADPDTFEPERFSSEATKQRHRYAFMPFGAGPRTCVGSAFATMEAVAVLAVISKTFRLARTSTDMPKASMRITLRPAAPLLMRIEEVRQTFDLPEAV